jgi:hypothetical protein
MAGLSVLLEAISRVCDEAGNTGNVNPTSVRGLKQARIIPLMVLDTTDEEYQRMYAAAQAMEDTAHALATLRTLARAGL